MRLLLMEKLTKIEPLRESFYNNSNKTNNILYVLGGSQRSLERKFKTVASLYKNGSCKKIFLLSQPGNTEYDPTLGRNLTNDEWAINKLIESEVKKEDIEPIVIKEGYWGTLTEAKGISDIVLRRGYKNLILVTSLSHTMRSWLSFSVYLKDKDVRLYIYASNERISLPNLLVEYFKVFTYKNIVLPIYHETGRLD